MPAYVRRAVDRLVEMLSPEMILVCNVNQDADQWIRINLVVVMPDGTPGETQRGIWRAAYAELCEMDYLPELAVIDMSQYDRNLGRAYTNTYRAARDGYIAYEARAHLS